MEKFDQRFDFPHIPQCIAKPPLLKKMKVYRKSLWEPSVTVDDASINMVDLIVGKKKSGRRKEVTKNNGSSSVSASCSASANKQLTKSQFSVGSGVRSLPSHCKSVFDYARRVHLPDRYYKPCVVVQTQRCWMRAVATPIGYAPFERRNERELEMRMRLVCLAIGGGSTIDFIDAEQGVKLAEIGELMLDEKYYHNGIYDPSQSRSLCLLCFVLTSLEWLL